MVTQRILLTLAACIASSGVLAQTAPAQSVRVFTVQSENAPVEALAKWVADATGRKIVVASNVFGLLSLGPAGSLTAEELYTAFQVALRSKGYVVEERDGALYVGAKP